MDWLTKFKRLMGVPEDDFYDENQPEEPKESKRDQFFASKHREEEPSARYEPKRETYYETREDKTESRRSFAKSNDQKFMNINATAQLQVILVKADDFREAAQIADHLINKKTVLLNLEGVNRDVVRRMIDFLSGVAYAQGGTLKRVANSTFIVTPYDVNIMGDVLDELKMERSGF